MKIITKIFSTWFGLGLLPGPTGTYGTLGAVVVYWLVHGIPALHYILAVVVFIFVASFFSQLHENFSSLHDDGSIVIDEVAGFLVTMGLVPFSWQHVLLGFILFRLFDILKPFPIRLIDQKLKGGWGVVLDDVLAGVFANLILHGIIYVTYL